MINTKAFINGIEELDLKGYVGKYSQFTVNSKLVSKSLKYWKDSREIYNKYLNYGFTIGFESLQTPIFKSSFRISLAGESFASINEMIAVQSVEFNFSASSFIN